MLEDHAKISRARRARYGNLPADVESWWQQIEATALWLNIKTERGDWQAWPAALEAAAPL